MNNSFEHFPTTTDCLICHTKDDKPGILVPLDDPPEGNFERALPVHLDCLTSKIRLMAHHDIHLFYLLAHHPPRITRNQSELPSLEDVQDIYRQYS